MGNTHSMNNTMLDQKRYSAEFLRYSQIPYESQYQQQHQSMNANMNFHQFNEMRKQQNAVQNPVKVLPDVSFEPKLRTTNNGAILQSGGTISGRKDSDCGLHRSKSISETQNTYLSNPNGHMPCPPTQFKMQRASTQLSINLQQPMRGNLNKNFGSSHDIKMPDMKSFDRRQEKARDAKKGRAPPPPINNRSENLNSNRIKMTPPPTSQAPDPPTKTKNKAPMGQRLFGDTLTKNHQNRNSQQSQVLSKVPTNNIKSKELIKPASAVSKVLPAPSKPMGMSKINPISYLRRERTFDMSLIQTQNNDKFKPKFSPQFQRKTIEQHVQPLSRAAETRQLSTQERYRASLGNRALPAPAFHSELQSVTKRRSLAVTNAERLKNIDQPLKKPAPVPEKQQIKAPFEHKKSSDNSAISNPTVSASSSFKYSKPKPEISYEIKEQEELKFSQDDHHLNLAADSSKDQLNNFYFGMQEASVDTDDDDGRSIDNDAQMEAINKFAEDIFKMSSCTGGGSTYDYLPQSQVSTESLLSDGELQDSDSSDILLNLRPTLPRRQLQIPRFSPVAAWRSLLVEANLSEKNGKLNSSLTQLHNGDERQETKIERIYREPSFHLLTQQLDNKSGDSGISAGEGNSPENQLPPAAYLMSSWTPQQDLEEDDEESVGGNDKESFQPTDADKSQSFVNASNGHMFSLSLPRDGHSVSDKTPQNNFYSLQKFRKSVVDVFGSITNVNDNKVQIHNYGMDSNWLLGSQPNSIDDFSPRKEMERNQIISQVTSGKHVMYLPTNMEHDEYDHKFDSNQSSPNDYKKRNSYAEPSSPISKFRDEEETKSKSKSKSKSHKFKFQSTIRQVERRKIAEKLSKEAEEKEMHRLSELEAMQKVEEEFQKKRAREKNMIFHQLRMVSMEENYITQSNEKLNIRTSLTEDINDIDNRTPYISRIISQKSPKIVGSQYKS